MAFKKYMEERKVKSSIKEFLDGGGIMGKADNYDASKNGGKPYGFDDLIKTTGKVVKILGEFGRVIRGVKSGNISGHLESK